MQYYFESEKVTDDIGDIEGQCTDGSTVAMFLLANGESVEATISMDYGAIPCSLGLLVMMALWRQS